MLLLHQTGAVKVGEVVRYKITYTPSLDRILPPPTHLYVKIKNTAAIPLRAAYLHGPYTLYVSGHPSTFDPNLAFEDKEEHGEPEYEPQLKAGGHWSTKLQVPESIRQSAEISKPNEKGERKSFTWIIEIASQVLFSRSVSVPFELLVGRDEKSVQSGLAGVVQVGSGQGMPGKLEDVRKKRQSPVPTEQSKGVFSKAIRVVIEDTETLWNSPDLPSWDRNNNNPATQSQDGARPRTPKTPTRSASQKKKKKPQRRIHLVLLTHGLHSNLGADMLYMKESIDAAAKKARKDAHSQRSKMRAQMRQQGNQDGKDGLDESESASSRTGADETKSVKDDTDNEDEEVVVRGFNGNAVRTEKGIQYLGKRLAKYVLSLTYPDQPYLPVKNSLSLTKTISRTFTGPKENDPNQVPAHKHSSIVKDDKHAERDTPFRVTSISFIGHSLGGLIQTYAIAYIQKHSPEFFDRIAPINFVALATPFLGLSNENPTYVKFALNFGLVGRTGQDLGLTWRPPTIARSGWGAVVNGLVNDPQKEQEPDPGAKPLLRILPTGPAHNALKRFRNRTVYSNVVNDGIVPLRTSCLLFLDYRGLDRVHKARRDNGLVGTMVNWGWNEISGQNVTTFRKPSAWNDSTPEISDTGNSSSDERGSIVPQAEASQELDFEKHRESDGNGLTVSRTKTRESVNTYVGEDARQQQTNAWSALLAYFKPQAGKSQSEDSKAAKSRAESKSRKASPKPAKIYRRGQTIRLDSDSGASTNDRQTPPPGEPESRRGPVRGASLYADNSEGESLEAPPRTSVFEAAGDILNPPLPPRDFLLDPAARPRTIFHDRVYHPDDIPMPPVKRRKTLLRLTRTRSGSEEISEPDPEHNALQRIPTWSPGSPEEGTMKIEEKIARAYHKDMSWRKVLVRLEPDAHNNLIVRRMFANAYGWPVVKHLCDTHFAYTEAAVTRDEDEPSKERAGANHKAVGEEGEQVAGQIRAPVNADIEDNRKNEPRRKSRDDSMPAEKQSTSELTKQKSPTSKFKDRHLLTERTPSELRESRDEVTDLVSKVTASGETSAFGSMHSGVNPSSNTATATLYRLQRWDSARWSDKYFEGSEDESDDEDAWNYRELMRTRSARGYATDSDNDDSRPSSRGLTKTRTAGSTNSALLVGNGKALVEEPGRMTQDESIVSGGSRPNEAKPRTSSLTGVGLGSKVLNTVAENTDEQDGSGMGIARKVATAQGKADSTNQASI